MMTERQLIERFLELQEHPELVSDEQLQQALDNPKMRELAEQVAFAKRAFINKELQEQECDIKEEWRKFANKHFDEKKDTKLDVASSMGSPVSGDAFQSKKIAASFIGLLVVSGITFAAIHIVRLHRDARIELKSPTQEMRISSPYQQMAPTDTTIKTAPPAILEPVVFDNVRLDEMLPRIAAFYHAEVIFQNESTRGLRFHFVWKHEDGLEHAIEKLNRFESLTVRLEQNKIIVE